MDQQEEQKIAAAVVRTHAKEIKWLVKGGGQALPPKPVSTGPGSTNGKHGK